MEAVDSDCLDIIPALLKAGADMDAQDNVSVVKSEHE
jgi:hypothetical protein